MTDTFSSYKHHNTAKGLIAIAPHGAVVFASALYGGRTSDNALVQHCGILLKLEKGDAVTADRCFEISHLLPDGVTLVIPSFMNGQAQLTKGDDQQSRSVALLHAPVERIIR